MSLEAHSAERAVLTILIKSPDSFFEIDDIISDSDFTNTGASMIFSILKKIIISDRDVIIDKQLILNEAEDIDGFFFHTLNGELVEALCNSIVSKNNLKRYVASIKQASIKRTLITTCNEIKDSIEEYDGCSIDLRNMVENTILDSLRKIDSEEDDIVPMSNGFEETIENYANLDGHIGVDVGLHKFQKDVGYIRNGAITGIFASTKVGKSQFALWSAFQNAIINRLPTLILDTELQLRQQQMRLCGVMTGISYSTIETGEFRGDKEQYAKIKNAYKLIETAPIFYKNIAGRSVHSVIPTIRKFVYKQMGGPVIGDNAKGLVIYDYIKLMDSKDISHQLQEYQLIGLLMSGLHDCAAHLNIPIIALGQLNKQEDIGIRRIVENVDSATILRQKRQEELESDGAARGTHVLEVRWARNGIGHNFGEWINIHFDKSCGQFIEDKRNSEVSSTLQNLKSDLLESEMVNIAKLKEGLR